jgi:hypothetical protein
MTRPPLIVLAGLLTLLAQPASAEPAIGIFRFEDTGLMGCSGAAGRRGNKGWEGPLYAAWDFQGTMVLNVGGRLRSIAYTRSEPVEGAPPATPRTLSGRLGNYTVDLSFTTKRTGYETSGGNGALRIYSGQPGDSISIPVYVAEGC